MTPTQIIALIRDILIVGGLGFLVLKIYSAGESEIQKKDLEAVTKQLTQNSKDVAAWAEQERNAEAQRQVDVQTITAAVASHTDPIRLCSAASSGSVSNHPPTPSSGPPASGGSDKGPGEDIRPAISAFEFKYESSLSACRSILMSWPKGVPP